jgi:HD-like signal output (HDOD) protein
MIRVVLSTNRAAILEGVTHLPALPSAALKIIEVSNDITSSPKDLMDIIKLDPVLTGRILNLVNSTYFSMPQRISSLNRALILLGFNTIKNIALSTAFLDASHSGKRLKEVDQLWQHMLAVGVVSKMIAAKLGQPRKTLEEFFVAGLLHDIGDLMLFRFAANESLEILNSGREKTFQQGCREKLDITGAECGEAVMKHWKLPDIFCDIVHHEERFGSESPMIINTIHVANKLISSLNIGLVTCPTPPLGIDEFFNIGLHPDALQEIRLDLPAELEKAQIFMAHAS